MNARTSTLAVTVTLTAAVVLTGCGPKAHTAVTPAAPTAVASAAGGAGGAGTAGTAGGAGKTCSAGHTRATINGTVKCLAPGQECSAKAITQYPRYGFVCATVNGRLVLHRA